MSMSAFENPKKKKINTKRLDSAVDRYINENTFTIEIQDSAGKPLAIEFKRFMSPIQLGGLLRQASSTSIIRDAESGGMLFDAPSLELSIHNYILTALSSFEIPLVIDEDDTSIDVTLLGIYGAYFRSISAEYENVYTQLYLQCKAVIDAKLKNYERMMDSVLTSLNMGQMLSDENILGAMTQAIQQAATPSNDNTIVPFPPQE